MISPALPDFVKVSFILDTATGKYTVIYRPIIAWDISNQYDVVPITPDKPMTDHNPYAVRYPSGALILNNTHYPDIPAIILHLTSSPPLISKPLSPEASHGKHDRSH